MRAITLLWTSSQSEVFTKSYGAQNREIPNFGNFGTPIGMWGLWRGTKYNIRGEGGGFPQV